MRIASELADEYGIDIEALSRGHAAGEEPRTGAESNGAETNGAEKPMPIRVGQLRDYLRESGPAKRAKILKDTGIPVGTIGSLLADYCEKTDSGLWQWKEKDQK